MRNEKLQRGVLGQWLKADMLLSEAGKTCFSIPKALVQIQSSRDSKLKSHIKYRGLTVMNMSFFCLFQTKPEIDSYDYH